MAGLMACAHQTQDCQQRRDKNAIGPLGAHLEVGDAIPCADEKQQRHRRQNRPRQGIETQPRIRCDRWRIDEHPERQQRVENPGSQQQPGSCAIARPEQRHRRRHKGHDDEEEGFHSRSTVSLRVSSESKARWMRSTMMPMMKTPTVRSSSTPASTSSGIALMISRPKR